MQPYDQDYYLTRERWPDWRMERDHLMMLAHVAPGMRVLDVGAGAGGLASAVMARGAYAAGVETERAAARLMCKRLPDAGVVQISEDVPGLPFASAAFDALVAQHVVEHFHDPAAALAAWRRVVRPGARVALATPNARYPDPAHFADPHHTHIFTSEELAALLRAAGFEVEQVYTLFPYLPHVPGWGRLSVWLSGLARRLPRVGMRGRTLMVGATNPRAAPLTG